MKTRSTVSQIALSTQIAGLVLGGIWACEAPTGNEPDGEGLGGDSASGGRTSLAGSNGDGGSQSHPSGGKNGTGGKASGGASTGGGSVGGADVGGSSSGGANQAGAGGDDGSGGSGCSGDCPFPVTALGAGYQQSCALSGLGQVTCWGNNTYGQVGLEFSSSAEPPPKRVVNLGETARAISLSVGGEHNCALLGDGSIKCWGSGSDGELGSGSTDNIGDGAGEMGSQLSPVALGGQAQARSLASGYRHNCVLLVGGGAKCWGRNLEGQLGLGDVANRGDEPGEMGDSLSTIDLGSGRTAMTIAAGSQHTCALLDDDSVKCWGFSQYGQTGLGDTENRGDEPGEMGDSLATVDLGEGRSAKRLSAGGGHTCAILDDDSVKCWGFNDRGQLGLGDTENRGDEPGEMGDQLPRVPLGADRAAKAISSGMYHTCAILDDDTVKCWGLGQYGALGQGDALNRGDEPGEMGDALPTVQLGTGQTILSLATGGAHTCALFHQGAVKCWGINWFAQLGTADGNNLGDEPNEMGDNLPAVSLW